MTMRRNLRAALALLAAYGLALHTTLLAITIPAMGPLDQPICSTVAPGDQVPGTPASHGHDCSAACLAAGGGAGVSALDPAGTVYAEWSEGRSIVLASGSSSAPRSVIAGAYRSRAPPLG